MEHLIWGKGIGRGGRLGEIRPQEGWGHCSRHSWDSGNWSCDTQAWCLLFTLFSSEALEPQGLEPSFSETARRRWLRQNPTLDPVLQEEDLRSESRWQLWKGQKVILAERKGEEHEPGGSPPGPHPLGVWWQRIKQRKVRGFLAVMQALHP